MGNSDSKQSRTSRQSITSSSSPAVVDPRAKIGAYLKSEFDKYCDITTDCLSSEAFHTCLRSVQEEFDLYNIADSPLCVGLFALSAVERPGGRPVMTRAEYTSATSALLNSEDIALTNKSILQWHGSSRKTTATDEILTSFYEASYRFAFAEMNRKLLSNMYLNGTWETDAISRFSELHVKKLAVVDKSSGDDRTIHLCVGTESVSVPTSFSYLSAKSRPASVYPQL